MKLAIISSKYYIGGHPKSLIPFVKALSKRKVHVDLFAFDRRSYDGVFCDENVNVLQIDHPPKTPNKSDFIISLLNPHTLHSVIKQKKLAGNNAVGQARWLKSIRNCPNNAFDFSQYDCVISWEESACNYYLNEKITANRKIAMFHTDYAQANFSPYVDLQGYCTIDKILCVSSASADTMKKSLPHFSDKISYIYNLIDVDDVDKKSTRFVPDFQSKFNMVTVCRLENKSKALDRAVSISKQLLSDGFDFAWYFIGDGKDHKMFKTLIQENGLENNIFLLGSKENPYPYIKNADLFVLQSYYEGKPLVVEEALVLKKPVLISNYSSACEQVVDGYNGFICENDEKSIYKKITHLIQSRSELTVIEDNLKLADNSKYINPDKFLEVITNEN